MLDQHLLPDPIKARIAELTAELTETRQALALSREALETAVKIALQLQQRLEQVLRERRDP